MSAAAYAAARAPSAITPYRSRTTAWAMQGMDSPCPEETVESSAPVATNKIFLRLPVIIL